MFDLILKLIGSICISILLFGVVIQIREDNKLYSDPFFLHTSKSRIAIRINKALTYLAFTFMLMTLISILRSSYDIIIHEFIK